MEPARRITRPQQSPQPAGRGMPAAAGRLPSRPAKRLRPSQVPVPGPARGTPSSAVPPAAVHDGLAGPGQPLPGALRREMEDRLSADLSEVRLHAGSAAGASAAAIGARAYTAGSHVVIGAEGADKHTLAHELTHVIQQRRGPVAGRASAGGVRMSEPGDAFERAAEANASRVMRGAPPARAAVAGYRPPGGPARPAYAGGPVVQRRPILQNADTLEYLDEDVPDQPLAFASTVEEARKNLGVFLDYNKLQAIFDFFAAQIRKSIENFGVVGKRLPEAFAEKNKTTPKLGEELKKLVGTVWVENPDYALKALTADVWIKNPAIIRAIIQRGEAGVAGYRPEGGGSRLPEAKGTLYYNAGTYRSREDALTRGCGVSTEELPQYAKVKGEGKTSAEILWLEKNLKNTGHAGLFIEFNDCLYLSTVQPVAPDKSRRASTELGSFKDFTGLGATQLNELNLSYQKIRRPPTTTDWITNLSGGRNGDQNAVMRKWSAYGAALFSKQVHGNANLPTDQNWEWLHIHGAQIGGATGSDNLLAGTFVANSEMIPYESQLKAWRTENAGKIFARFSAKARDHVLAEEISIEVAAQDHPVLGTIDRSDPLKVIFYPLRGEVIDRLTGQIRKKQWHGRGRGLQPPLVIPAPMAPLGVPPPSALQAALQPGGAGPGQQLVPAGQPSPPVFALLQSDLPRLSQGLLSFAQVISDEPSPELSMFSFEYSLERFRELTRTGVLQRVQEQLRRADVQAEVEFIRNPRKRGAAAIEDKEPAAAEGQEPAGSVIINVRTRMAPSRPRIESGQQPGPVPAEHAPLGPQEEPRAPMEQEPRIEELD